MVIIDEINAKLAALPDDGSRSSRLRRNSYLAFRARFEARVPPLKLRFDSSRAITATDLAAVTKALQDATARSAMLIIHPNQDRQRISADVRARVNLLPRSQSGNTIFFDFPRSVAEQTDIIRGDELTHLAEHAVRELIEALPESGDDYATLEALPGRRQTIRAAIKTLASAVKDTDSISLTLENPGGGAERSVLTVEQAREVPELLSATREEVSEVLVTGLMDGIRTRRRLFYILDDEHQREYVGSVEPSQLGLVQGVMGSIVEARLRKVVQVKADGSRSHPTYALRSLSTQQEGFGS
ncbi:hypothetical protein [Agromyces larvae]|uniref:Uncharacterized protein n=1 Tax=Agromyces larvae TaxID=2929802 RepID=A0ABY4C3M8_9MICO|nr:hypothetical protein [Agromyces larvae]UOE45584.1 hypothetical protein MTO99_07485 [Agromyces larvae]